MNEERLRQVLQDISAIAKKALEDVQRATESDWPIILGDGLEAIVELCQFEQMDREARF